MRVYSIDYAEYEKSDPRNAIIVAKSAAGALAEFDKVLRKRHYTTNLDVYSFTITAGQFVHRVQR